jgi:diguanylate cyclase (GGDEF)-like protein
VRSLNSPGGQTAGWAIIIRDVTLQDQQHNELKRIAYLDELTGLGNRRQLEITAQNVLSPEGQGDWQITLIYLDLNAFKPINKNYGHEAGDLVLNHVVVRLGEDEFVMLLFRANRSDADIVSDRVQYYLQKPVEFQSNLLQAQASIGIACFPQNGQTLRDLLHHADQEMYQYKQASRVEARR